jgi:hypothetical protein
MSPKISTGPVQTHLFYVQDFYAFSAVLASLSCARCNSPNFEWTVPAPSVRLP